jgi:hypothetical protein
VLEPSFHLVPANFQYFGNSKAGAEGFRVFSGFLGIFWLFTPVVPVLLVIVGEVSPIL